MVHRVRLLFVSGTTTGGSGRSQRELALRLASRGHDVVFLVDDGGRSLTRRFLYEQLSDLAVRWDTRPGHKIIRFLEGKPGRRTRTHLVDGLEHRVTPVPENAAPDLIRDFQPDVVISNSILRITWRKVREMCDRSQIATVVYVREVASMNHFALGRQPGDVIVANASSLARNVEALGYPCAVLPSVIEVGVTRVDSTRTVALIINPIVSHGIDLVWQVARALPEVSFVIQQSWPLDDTVLASIERTVSELPNVEFRRAVPAGISLYSDARVLLVPHRIDNRPRVIAEAQANGIPVVASNTPGIAEAVGDGGNLIDMDDVGRWVESVRLLWTDPPAYDTLADRALTHSRRPEIDPEQVTMGFEKLLLEAIASRRQQST